MFCFNPEVTIFIAVYAMRKPKDLGEQQTTEIDSYQAYLFHLLDKEYLSKAA